MVWSQSYGENSGICIIFVNFLLFWDYLYGHKSNIQNQYVKVKDDLEVIDYKKAIAKHQLDDMKIYEDLAEPDYG